MKLFHVYYFDTIQYEWQDKKFIAINTEQIKSLIDNTVPLEFRIKRKFPSNEEYDTLKIDEIKDLTLPINVTNGVY